MKNPILRYRIAVAVLLAALLTISLAYRQQAQENPFRQEINDLAVHEMREAQERADRAESRLRSIERGAIIPQGTRKAIAAEVKAGGSILVPELDEPSVR